MDYSNRIQKNQRMNKELTAASPDKENVPKISARGTSPPYSIKESSFKKTFTEKEKIFGM